MAFNDKQLHIINTAEKLFADRGYNGTSVRDIAEEAQVNIAMISYYFGSKDKLMQALFEERTSYIIGKVEGLLHDHSLQPQQKIDALIDDYVDRLMFRQDFYKIMIQEQVLQKNSPVTLILSEQKKRNAGLITQLITEGQDKGIFRKDVDVLLLLNTMVGAGIQSFINKDYYRLFNNMEAMADAEYQEQFKLRLSQFIKALFKAYLKNDEQDN